MIRYKIDPSIERRCPIHGTWVFPPDALDAAIAFEDAHAECRFTGRGRGTPRPKSRRSA